MAKYNRRGLVSEADLIEQILDDKNNCTEYSETETGNKAEISITKFYKNEELYITYTVDNQLFQKYKSLRKDTKL